MPTCSLSAAVLGRTPVNLPVSSRTGTVPRLFMLMLRPRPRGTAPALTGHLQNIFTLRDTQAGPQIRRDTPSSAPRVSAKAATFIFLSMSGGHTR